MAELRCAYKPQIPDGGYGSKYLKDLAAVILMENEIVGNAVNALREEVGLPRVDFAKALARRLE